MYDLPIGLRMLIAVWFVLALLFCFTIIAYAVADNPPETKTECLENGSSVMEFGNNALCSLNNDGEYYTVRNE